MKKFLKGLGKYMFLLIFGGLIYNLIEIAYRGHTHWTMFILGGLCFVALGSINNILEWETPLICQSLIGGVIITVLEYITGYIVNIKLQWNVWDYSDILFNIQGQICFPFFILWVFISMIGIIVDDYLRYWIFKERKPTYTLV